MWISGDISKLVAILCLSCIDFQCPGARRSRPMTSTEIRDAALHIVVRWWSQMFDETDSEKGSGLNGWKEIDGDWYSPSEMELMKEQARASFHLLDPADFGLGGLW